MSPDDASDQDGARPAQILFICTANICRSPYAHLTLERRLAAAGVSDIEVASAGVAAGAPHPVAEGMIELLRRRDIDASTRLSRRFDPRMAGEAALILTASKNSRAAVVAAAPAALKKTFTLRQFERLLASAEPPRRDDENGSARIERLLDAARAARGRSVPGDDDVPDPWLKPMAEYERSAAIIDSAVATIARALIGR